MEEALKLLVRINPQLVVHSDTPHEFTFINEPILKKIKSSLNRESRDAQVRLSLQPVREWQAVDDEDEEGEWNGSKKQKKKMNSTGKDSEEERGRKRKRLEDEQVVNKSPIKPAVFEVLYAQLHFESSRSLLYGFTVFLPEKLGIPIKQRSPKPLLQKLVDIVGFPSRIVVDCLGFPDEFERKLMERVVKIINNDHCQVDATRKGERRSITSRWLYDLDNSLIPAFILTFLLGRDAPPKRYREGIKEWLKGKTKAPAGLEWDVVVKKCKDYQGKIITYVCNIPDDNLPYTNAIPTDELSAHECAITLANRRAHPNYRPEPTPKNSPLVPLQAFPTQEKRSKFSNHSRRSSLPADPQGPTRPITSARPNSEILGLSHRPSFGFPSRNVYSDVVLNSSPLLQSHTFHLPLYTQDPSQTSFSTIPSPNHLSTPLSRGESSRLQLDKPYQPGPDPRSVLYSPLPPTQPSTSMFVPHQEQRVPATPTYPNYREYGPEQRQSVYDTPTYPSHYEYHPIEDDASVRYEDNPNMLQFASSPSLPSSTYMVDTSSSAGPSSAPYDGSGVDERPIVRSEDTSMHSSPTHGPSTNVSVPLHYYPQQMAPPTHRISGYLMGRERFHIAGYENNIEGYVRDSDGILSIEILPPGWQEYPRLIQEVMPAVEKFGMAILSDGRDQVWQTINPPPMAVSTCRFSYQSMRTQGQDLWNFCEEPIPPSSMAETFAALKPTLGQLLVDDTAEPNVQVAFDRFEAAEDKVFLRLKYSRTYRARFINDQPHPMVCWSNPDNEYSKRSLVELETAGSFRGWTQSPSGLCQSVYVHQGNQSPKYWIVVPGSRERPDRFAMALDAALGKDDKQCNSRLRHGDYFTRTSWLRANKIAYYTCVQPEHTFAIISPWAWVMSFHSDYTVCETTAFPHPHVPRQDSTEPCGCPEQQTWLDQSHSLWG